MAAIRWLSYDWPNRKKYTLDLMSRVRFGLILPWQLLEFATNTTSPEIERVIDHPKVARMVDMGFA